MHAIDQLIQDLAATPVQSPLFNQYAPFLPANSVRCDNLRVYLESIRTMGPDLVLVGEAAGYRGCRVTGIPFTSEDILLQSRPRALSHDRGEFKSAGEAQRHTREQSATIVWQTIGEWERPPLLWNALPFHPHQPEQPWSNRTPTQAELHVGIPFLLQVLELFGRATPVAIGRKAASVLETLNIAYREVRHPAHGGKRAFIAGLQEIRVR